MSRPTYSKKKKKVNPWLIHVNVWQKALQYCKVISLQLIKINEKKNRYKKALYRSLRFEEAACCVCTYDYKFVCVCAQSHLTLCNHGRQPARLLWQWYFPGKNMPFPTPGDFSNQGIKPRSLVSPALAGRFFTNVPPVYDRKCIQRYV